MDEADDQSAMPWVSGEGGQYSMEPGRKHPSILGGG